MGKPTSIPLSRARRRTGAVAGLVLALGAVSSFPVAARAGDLANVDDGAHYRQRQDGHGMADHRL